MNNANPIQAQSPPSQQPSLKNSATGNKPISTQKETFLEKNSDEQEINLNALFPDAKTDLNNLFPDTEVKHLLKNIIKNKKDMGSIKERLTNENETPTESTTANESSGPNKTESTQRD